MDVLTSEKREKVLIIDDSTYDRSRSKVVELLAWVHDHNANRSLKGFKLMTLGWSDGVSCVFRTKTASVPAGKRPPFRWENGRRSDWNAAAIPVKTASTN